MENRWIKSTPFLCVAAFILLILSISFNVDGWILNWTGHALRGFLTYSLVFFSVAGVFFYINKAHAAIVLLFCSLLFLFAILGFSESCAVFLLFFSLYCSGRLVLRLVARKDFEHLLLESFVVGLALYILGFGWLSSTNYNSREIYLLILVLPIIVYAPLCFFKAGAQFYCELKEDFLQQLNSIRFRSLAFMIFIFTYVGAYSFFPTVMWDDNVLHLSWWTQLEYKHTYKPDVVAQIWSVAPFSVDLLHAIASVVAGADARGAMNLSIFSILILSLYRLAGFIDRDASRRTLIVTLFITTPMAANLLLGLQTDLFLSLISVLGVLVVYKLDQQFTILGLLALFALGAVCATTKLPAILIGLGLLVAAAPVVYRNRTVLFQSGLLAWVKYGLLFIVIAIAAFYPYINAFLETRNPVFPLYNGVFKSSFFPPVNFLDDRYSLGASFKSFWGMFFHTSTHFESKNYIAGFQYLFLLPLALASLLFVRLKNSYFITIPLFFYALPMFFTLQYVRYFYEILPLASVLMLTLLVGNSGKLMVEKLTRYSFVGFIWVNLFFLPGVSWNFSLSPFLFIKSQAKETFAAGAAPEIELNKQINSINKNAKVLFDLARPYGATLSGTPFYNAWYSPTYSKEIMSWTDKAGVKNSVDNWRIDYVYWNNAVPFSQKNTTRNLLGAYLNEYGYAELQVGPMVAFRVADKPVEYDPIVAFESFNGLNGFDVKGAPLITERSQIELHSNDVLTLSFSVKPYSQFKYHVEFECASPSDSFIAQLNWNLGEPYYKLVDCSSDKIVFDEVGLIPQGAATATLYLSFRGGNAVKVNNLSIGLR